MGKQAQIATVSTAADLRVSGGLNINALRTNTVLRKDEWKEMDDEVVQISRYEMIGVEDLVSRGLVKNLKNGLGTTVLEYEDISDMTDATMDMAADTLPDKDRVKFSVGYLPLPITHHGFDISARMLESSRTRGESLDVTQVGISARKVSELVEKTLYTGSSTYTFGGGTVHGYMTHGSRVTGSLTANWDDSVGDVMTDVHAMIAALRAVKKYGPYALYVPGNFEGALDEDYVTTTATTITVRQRIEQIQSIEFVKSAHYLTADNVVLVELKPSTVRMVIGMQPTTVEWQTMGGLVSHYKVMAIMVPQIFADQDGNCGVAHYS